ncbi:MAG: AAA family ATPase [Verrucomicrobia bacterium]|nr:AAA family ATPase [Verrucomicrobiota bacterium]
MAMTDQTRCVLDFLSRPESYPHRPKQVTMVQTHASWVFIASPLVCKIKKPVNLGFLDFSTLELRHEDCEREIVLNRRLAEDIYLGVESIRQHDGALQFGGNGEIVEWCVMMCELDSRFLLSHLLKEGSVGAAEMDRIVDKLSRFHAAQPPLAPDEAATAIERLRLATDGNFQVARDWIGKSLSQSCFDIITHFTNKFFDCQNTLLKSRILEGWIRDCHGDLHAEHIHLAPNAVRIYDCIEFNTRFRHIDIANDIAFLAMDLDGNGRPDLARHLVTRFADLMNDPGMMPLMDFYKCYRACVRGKVESLHSAAETAGESERAESLAKARRYYQLALRYAVAGSEPCAFVFMGRIASGKSALASAFSKEIGWLLLSSDQLRKQIAGIPANQRGDATLYSPEMNARTYGALFAEAASVIQTHHGVILDATFSRRRDRDAFGDQAKKNGCRVIWIEAVVSDEIAQKRLLARDSAPVTVSDARIENFTDLSAAYEAPEEIPSRHTLNNEAQVCDVLRKLLLELAQCHASF